MKEPVNSFSMYCPAFGAFKTYLQPVLDAMDMHWEEGEGYGLDTCNVWVNFLSGRYAFVDIRKMSHIRTHVHVAGFDHALFVAVMHSRGNKIFKGDYVKTLLESDTMANNQIFKVARVASPLVYAENGEALNMYSEVIAPDIRELIEYYTVMRSHEKCAPYNLKSGDAVWMWDDDDLALRGYFGGVTSNGTFVCWIETPQRQSSPSTVPKVVKNVLPAEGKLIVPLTDLFEAYSRLTGLPVENLHADLSEDHGKDN